MQLALALGGVFVGDVRGHIHVLAHRRKHAAQFAVYIVCLQQLPQQFAFRNGLRHAIVLFGFLRVVGGALVEQRKHFVHVRFALVGFYRVV